MNRLKVIKLMVAIMLNMTGISSNLFAVGGNMGHWLEYVGPELLNQWFVVGRIEGGYPSCCQSRTANRELLFPHLLIYFSLYTLKYPVNPVILSNFLLRAFVSWWFSFRVYPRSSAFICGSIVFNLKPIPANSLQLIAYSFYSRRAKNPSQNPTAESHTLRPEI